MEATRDSYHLVLPTVSITSNRHEVSTSRLHGTRRTFGSEDLEHEAVKVVGQLGVSKAEVARDLRIGVKLLGR